MWPWTLCIENVNKKFSHRTHGLLRTSIRSVPSLPSHVATVGVRQFKGREDIEMYYWWWRSGGLVSRYCRVATVQPAAPLRKREHKLVECEKENKVKLQTERREGIEGTGYRRRSLERCR